MFWAWEKHQERMAKQRAEVQAELLAEIQAQARGDDMPEIAAWLEKVAREREIENSASQQR